MPEGLELLPGLLPQPIDKAVDLGSPTEANRRHAQSAQIGKTLVGGKRQLLLLFMLFADAVK